MPNKPNYADFRDAKPKELLKAYNITPRELEIAQRDVCYGANQAELRKEYDKFYRRNRKDA